MAVAAAAAPTSRPRIRPRRKAGRSAPGSGSGADPADMVKAAGAGCGLVCALGSGAAVAAESARGFTTLYEVE